MTQLYCADACAIKVENLYSYDVRVTYMAANEETAAIIKALQYEDDYMEIEIDDDLEDNLIDVAGTTSIRFDERVVALHDFSLMLYFNRDTGEITL